MRILGKLGKLLKRRGKAVMDEGLKRFRLEVTLAGSVPKEEVRWIVNTVTELYRVSPLKVPSLTKLVIVDTLARRRQLMQQDSRLAGAQSEEEFPATHEAWWGVPRIVACVESLKKLPKLVAQASVRVAAGHSILHGSREHYLFRIPADLVRRGREKGWEPELLERLMYLVASGVKNLAVAKFLVRCGFVAEQTALALNQLEIDDQERSLWQMVEKDTRSQALYMAALLRNILFAYPVLPYAPVVASAMVEMTSHLPQNKAYKLRALGMEIAYAFPGDSISFVNPAFEMLWRRLVEEGEG